MQTQPGTNGKGTGTGIGKGFPKSDANPEGYTLDERARRDKPKEKESVRGRKNQGQEAVINMESLQTRVEDLVKLNKAVASASTEYNDAIKKTAEQSGLLAATVRKYIDARAGDKFEEAKTKAQQLALAFEEVDAAA